MNIDNASSLDLFDDARVLLARIQFLAPSFQKSEGGVLRARVVRTVGLATGVVASFRLVGTEGDVLDEGPVDRLTINDRRIEKGRPL